MGLFDKKTKATPADDLDVKAEKAVAAKTETKTAKTVEVVKEAKVVKVVKPVKSTEARDRGVYGVLLSPLVTEKTTKEEQLGKYVFMVADNATKSEIIKAVETRYGVKPVKINVVNRLGKAKRFGRSQGKRKDWRKAVVTLPKGKAINVYETK